MTTTFWQGVPVRRLLGGRAKPPYCIKERRGFLQEARQEPCQDVKAYLRTIPLIKTLGVTLDFDDREHAEAAIEPLLALGNFETTTWRMTRPGEAMWARVPGHTIFGKEAHEGDESLSQWRSAPPLGAKSSEEDSGSSVSARQLQGWKKNGEDESLRSWLYLLRISYHLSMHSIL